MRPDWVDRVSCGANETMLLLQFDTTLSLSPAEKTSFAKTVTELDTTAVATTQGHVARSVIISGNR